MQLRVQVRCSVMPVLDGTRLNALCLVGWSLETRAGKRKEEQSIGPGKTVRSDDDSDRAPRCVYVLHDLEKEGKMVARACCRAGCLMVVHTASQG